MTLRLISGCCLMALLLALPACIPSKSETEKAAPPQASVSAPVQSVKDTPEAAPKQASDASSEPPLVTPATPKDGTSGVVMSLEDPNNAPPSDDFDENDAVAVAKRNEELAMSHGGVKVYTAEDGNGYVVEGAQGLKATIKKDPSGNGWVFDGEFTAKAEGLKVGKEQVSTVAEGVPYDGQDKNTVQGLYMIVIPIKLPDINAIETGDIYRVPVHFNLDVKGEAQFIVNTMTTNNL